MADQAAFLAQDGALLDGQVADLACDGLAERGFDERVWLDDELWLIDDQRGRSIGQCSFPLLRGGYLGEILDGNLAGGKICADTLEEWHTVFRP